MLYKVRGFLFVDLFVGLMTMDEPGSHYAEPQLLYLFVLGFRGGKGENQIRRSSDSLHRIEAD